MERVSNDLKFERIQNASRAASSSSESHSSPSQTWPGPTQPVRRRPALSGLNSPRAPKTGMQPQTMTPEGGNRTSQELVNQVSPLSPIPPLESMLDTPRTSANYVKMAEQRPPPLTVEYSSGSASSVECLDYNQQAGQQGELDLRPGDLDNLDETQLYVGGMDGTGPSTTQARPARRQALSGLNSPRAPGAKFAAASQENLICPNSPLEPLNQMLDSPSSSMSFVSPTGSFFKAPGVTHHGHSGIYRSDSSDSQPDLKVDPPHLRRRALSGVDSPRAPDQLALNVERIDGDLSLSPLEPLDGMLMSPVTSPVLQPNQPNRQMLMRVRRQALSGPDSPRAPNEGAKLGLNGVKSPPKTSGSPLAPLSEMLDTPPKATPADQTAQISLMQSRLSDAEDANIQWAEYCLQLQHYNSQLLSQVSLLQQKNAELQKQLANSQGAHADQDPAQSHGNATAVNQTKADASTQQSAASSHSILSPPQSPFDRSGVIVPPPIMPSSPLLQRLLNSSPTHLTQQKHL